MNIIVKSIQATAQFLILLAIIGMIGKLFFRKSLFGRFVLCFVKEMISGLKTSYRIIKYISKKSYKGTKIAYKFVANHYKTYKEREIQEEKIVVGESVNNVIDLNTFKQLRHKWDK